MPIITLRIPDELNVQISLLAATKGVSMHDLIVDAITEKVESLERLHQMHAVVLERLARKEATGQSIELNDIGYRTVEVENG